MLVPALALFALIGGLFPSFSLLANSTSCCSRGGHLARALRSACPAGAAPPAAGHRGLVGGAGAVLALVELVDFSLGSTYRIRRSRC